MSRDELKKDRQNCFSDLQRAATAFYLNPKGKTHLVFLKHARKILNKINNRKLNRFSLEISQLEDKISLSSKSQRIYIADKILTTGILIKNQI